MPNAVAISLGPRILRAETAALAALAAYHDGRRRLAVSGTRAPPSIFYSSSRRTATMDKPLVEVETLIEARPRRCGTC